MQIYPVIPQPLGTGDSPTFAGLTITGNSVFGLNSSVFQPATDSTTFFQVLDADGGNSVMVVDTTNEGVGVAGAIPNANIRFWAGGNSRNDGFLRVDGYILTYSTIGMGTNNTSFSMTDTEGTPRVVFLIDNADDIWIGPVGSPAGTTTRILFQPGSAAQMVLEEGGNLGLGGETAPETLAEWTHAQPYLTLHNSTHEDIDGGRESRLNFKGEQSGGEETTLARIEIGHDGAVDDEKGYLDIFINDGDDGDSPTKRVRVDSNGTLSTLFGRILKTHRLTGNTTLDATYHQVFCDTDGGAFTVTLPAGVAGTEYRIINTGSSANNLIIAPDGAELLLGVNANWTLFDGEALTIVYEATEGWY